MQVAIFNSDAKKKNLHYYFYKNVFFVCVLRKKLQKHIKFGFIVFKGRM